MSGSVHVSLPVRSCFTQSPSPAGDAIIFAITWTNTFECSALLDIKERIVPVTPVVKHKREDQVEVLGEGEVVSPSLDRA
jgi:hypothetical protein